MVSCISMFSCPPVTRVIIPLNGVYLMTETDRNGQITDRNGQITDPNGPKRTAERAEMQLISHWRLILNGYVAETDHWRLILNGSVAETDASGAALFSSASSGCLATGGGGSRQCAAHLTFYDITFE